MGKINDLIVSAAETIGNAVSAYQKAIGGYGVSNSRKPNFITGLTRESNNAWSNGTLSNPEETQRRAVRNNWFYVGVNTKALDFSFSKMDLYVNPGGLEDEGEKAVGHPFYKLIKRPNPYMGRSLLLQYTQWWMDLQGEAFWFIEPGQLDGSKVKGLWPIPSSRMDIEFSEDGKSIKNYIAKFDQWYYIDPKYIIHFKYPNPFDIFRGLPPLIAFMLTIDSDLAMKAWNARFFGKDNVMPSAVISLGSGDANALFEESDIQNFENKLRSEYSAINRKTAVTNANTMSVALLGYSAKEMDFNLGMGWNKDEILEALGVPASMFDKGATEANAKVGNKRFKDNMWGIKNLFCDELTAQLVVPFYSDDMELRPEDDRVYDRELELREAELAKDAMTAEDWAMKYFDYTLPEGEVSMNQQKVDQQMESKQQEIGMKQNPKATSNTVPSNKAPKNDSSMKSIVQVKNAPKYKPNHLPYVMLKDMTANKGMRTTEQLASFEEHMAKNGLSTSNPVIVQRLYNADVMDYEIRILDGKHRVDWAGQNNVEQIPVKVVDEELHELDPKLVYSEWLFNGATNMITEAKSIEAELSTIENKAFRWFRNKNSMKNFNFQSDVIDEDTLKAIVSDVSGVEQRSDIRFIFDHWEDKLLKGGIGSGEKDGHPFRGNQYTRSKKTDRPLNVYHITSKENISSILSQGLKPTSQVGKNPALSGSDIDYDVDGTFVANASQAKVIYDQLKDIGANPSVLEVYIPKGTTIHEDRLMPESSVIVEGGISKKRLREITFDDLGKRKDEFQNPFEKSIDTDYMKAFSWRPWSGFQAILTSTITNALQSILELFLETASEHMDVDSRLWEQTKNIFRQAVTPVYMQIATQASKDVNEMLTSSNISISYDLTNKSAIEWATQYAGDKIKGVGTTERKAVQKAIANWIEEGRDNGIEGLKERIRSLTDENGVPLFGKERADKIASNESVMVYAGATEASLVANGYPPAVYRPTAHVGCRCYIQPGLHNGDKVIVWYTTRDERVCKQLLDTPFGQVEGCKELHRTIVSEGHAGERYTKGMWNPETKEKE